MRLPVGNTAVSARSRWERHVLTRISVGDQAGMAELFAQFSPTVYGIAHHITDDPSAARSVSTAVFVDVWRQPERVAAAAAVHGLRCVLADQTRSAAREWRREHRLWPGASVDPVTTEAVWGRDLPDPAEAARADAARSQIATCLGALPESERRVLNAVVFAGDSALEAATRLGATAEMVATSLTSALRTLTAMLSPVAGGRG